MKLRKCYIENFGILSKRTFEFQDGLTVLQEDNGFGKTTLAAFIKAMLYGLPKTTRRSLSENPREKYKPWQGGSYGGYLEFEANGKSYRVERFFASRGSDSFKLYDLSHNGESCDFSSRLGEELFGIDAVSYEKSTFLPQREVTMEMTGSLNAKIGNLVDNTDDLNNFETACALLEKASRRYALKRGEGGLIFETKRKLTEKMLELESCEESSRQAERLETRLALLESEIASLQDKSQEATAAYLQAEQWDHYRSLLAAGEKAKMEFEEKRAFCGGKIPSAEKLQRALLLLQQIKTGTETLSDAERFRMEELQEFFKNGLPEKDELAIIGPYCAEYEFKVNELKKLPRENKKPPRGKAVWLLPVAAVLLLTGAFLLSYNLFAAVAAMMLGTVSFGAGLIAIKNSQKISADLGWEALALEVQGKQAVLERFFSRFYPEDRRDFSVMAEDLSRRVLEYELLIKQQETDDGKIKTAQMELESFLEQHRQPTAFPAESVLALQQAASAAELLSRKAEEALREAEQYRLEKGLKEESPLVFEDVSRELLALTEERNRLQLQHLKLLQQADPLQDVKGEAALLAEQLERFTKEHRQLNQTLSLLQKAKENLSGKYVNGIDRRLQYYLNMLSPELSGLTVDRELKVTADRFGEKKSVDYFSRGWQNLLEIALRLALIDVMYEGEQPFLILDDPFVNLDDKKIEKAKELLYKLSSHRQIIYLTCHSSRVL